MKEVKTLKGDKEGYTEEELFIQDCMAKTKKELSKELWDSTGKQDQETAYIKKAFKKMGEG